MLISDVVLQTPPSLEDKEGSIIKPYHYKITLQDFNLIQYTLWGEKKSAERCWGTENRKVREGERNRSVTSLFFRLEEEGYKTIVLLFTTLTGRGQAKQVRSATLLRVRFRLIGTEAPEGARWMGGKEKRRRQQDVVSGGAPLSSETAAVNQRLIRLIEGGTGALT